MAACEKCGHTHIAYNSCRNRHCPKCQGAAAKDWLAARQAELLPVEYYHVVFTLPAPIADIAYHNKAVIYGILFKAAAETLITIARDPKHLGARIGLIGVLHTWGSALTHHPHLHCIVPGGGLSPDGGRWISCRPGFFLPVRVLSRLFRRLFLDKLAAAHDVGRLRFFGNYRHLADAPAFAGYLGPLRKVEWVVYAKRPFAGPEAVLAYLSRYTHRVAIANSRLISLDDRGVTFTWKDYRIKGRRRRKIMTLATDEFIRRFLIHVLPTSFHRIRHYGLFANGGRAENLATVRELLALPQQQDEEQDTGANPGEPPMLAHPCPCCGGPMIIIETFERGARPRAPPPRRRTGNLMMVRSQNPNAARPCRRFSTGHGAVLPNPAPRRPRQRQSMKKAGVSALYDHRLAAPTSQTVAIDLLSLPSKTIARPSNPHRACKPIRRA